MSLSSVLIPLVGVLGLANLVLVLRMNRCAEERPEPAGEGANSVAAPPAPAISEHGTMAPDRRT